MALKMTPEHYDILKNGIAATVTANPEYVTKAVAHGFSTTRIRWDLFWASTFNGQSAELWMTKTLYPYLNDTHIDSALRKIVG